MISTWSATCAPTSRHPPASASPPDAPGCSHPSPGHHVAATPAARCCHSPPPPPPAVAVEVGGASSGPAARSAAVKPPAIRLTLTAQLLSTAAATVARHPAVRPGPHQWFYTKFVAHDYGQPTQSNENGKPSTAADRVLPERKADRAQDPGSLRRRRPQPPGRVQRKRYTADCVQRAGITAIEPQGTAGSHRQAGGQGRPERGAGSVVSLYAPKGRDEVEFDYLAQLLWNSATGEPPAAEAAVFRALAAIPGVSSQQRITDVVGRRRWAVR